MSFKRGDRVMREAREDYPALYGTVLASTVEDVTERVLVRWDTGYETTINGAYLTPVKESKR